MGRKSAGSAAKPPRGRRLKRALLTLLIGLPVAAIGLFVAANHLPWVGPLLADSLRAVIGTEAVAKLEDTTYGMQDRWNRFWRKDEKPKAYWSVPSAAPPRAAPKAQANKAPTPSLPPFHPKDVGPVLKSWSAPGDGEWVPIADARHPDDPPRMYKTLLHPDRYRSWAEVFVVAIDLRQTELKMMPGTREPKGETPEASKLSRPGLIPEADQGQLLAAFNGGWKTEHGHYGMRAGGVTLIKPRKTSCTVAGRMDGSIEIASWSTLADQEDELSWWRQTPSCMYEGGKMHALLNQQETAAWGATVDGETVIRRSAVGIDQAGTTLYVSITNHTTARAIADAMHFAGADTVAQLDVNWSYPKFLVYAPDESGQLEAAPLADGFEFTKGEYVRKGSIRDFFYVTRKTDAKAATDHEIAGPPRVPASKAAPAPPPG